MLPCFHLKQNGLNQIIVAQTLAVFLHLEISYYSGEAIYQKKRKKTNNQNRGKPHNKKTQWAEKQKTMIYVNLPVIHIFELFTFQVYIIYLENMIINVYFRVSLKASYVQKPMLVDTIFGGKFLLQIYFSSQRLV